MTQPELLKEEGKDLVESHNENFVDKMRLVAKGIAQYRGHVTSDDLREMGLVMKLNPTHPNAWGTIFRGAEWKPTGFTRSKFTSNHARMIRIWTLV